MNSEWVEIINKRMCCMPTWKFILHSLTFKIHSLRLLLLLLFRSLKKMQLILFHCHENNKSYSTLLAFIICENDSVMCARSMNK